MCDLLWGRTTRYSRPGPPFRVLGARRSPRRPRRLSLIVRPLLQRQTGKSSLDVGQLGTALAVQLNQNLLRLGVQFTPLHVHALELGESRFDEVRQNGLI